MTILLNILTTNLILQESSSFYLSFYSSHSISFFTIHSFILLHHLWFSFCHRAHTHTHTFPLLCIKDSSYLRQMRADEYWSCPAEERQMRSIHTYRGMEGWSLEEWIRSELVSTFAVYWCLPWSPCRGDTWCAVIVHHTHSYMLRYKHKLKDVHSVIHGHTIWAQKQVIQCMSSHNQIPLSLDCGCWSSPWY